MNLILLWAVLAVPSTYDSVNVEIDWDGSVKETTVSYTATAGDDGRFLRVSRNYDPDYMEVELLGAQYGHQGTMREVPGWAVETLTGAQGWDRALVAAFPGLMPGMTMEWSFRIRDRGHFASSGLFYTYIADGEPETITVSCPDLDGLNFIQTGFAESSRGDRLIFTSSGVDYRELWISSAGSWSEISDILLESSRSSASQTPPDLREAAIEAGAAGALPQMRISRGRLLLTESLMLLPFPGGDSGFEVRSLQEILDSRRATPMEAATLLSAMCRVMGIDAPVVPATDIMPPIPSPLGFHRAFIMAEGKLEEPSEYLSPAGWVDIPDTLWLLLPEGLLGELPPEPLAESCDEAWSISPESGRFTLELTASGGYDREIRRRLAGLDSQELLLRMAEWFRSSDVHFQPDSVQVSDLFDLTQSVEVTVQGCFPPGDSLWLEVEPTLNWNREGTVSRSFHGVARSEGVIHP